MPKARNVPTPSRRVFLGAATIGLLAGTGAASATPSAAGDVRLLGLADQLSELHSQTEALNNLPDPLVSDADRARVLDAYWDVADEIAAIPPTSAEGVRAHARALRSVIWQVGQEEGSIADHTDALIRAVLGEG